SDFSKPGKLVDARKSYYVHNNNFRSPMGLNVSAFINESEQLKFLTVNSGEKLNWIEVVELVKQDNL
ncbi:MAG: nitrous oxide reductase accessory protein NosL, partial [Ignavibacteria bacterium]|nr:nitrous oxide reductase accessory protein NosL [Ignavibacteria bacterium]